MSSELSSDILEKQFGQTTVDVLFQDDTHRIIQTRVVNDNRILELSYVTFDPNGTEAFPEIHQQIRDGESMGKAFTQANVAFVRETTAVFRSHVPGVFQDKFGSDQMPWITNTTVLVGPDSVRYATVLEMFHPDVEWPDPTIGHSWPSTQPLVEFERLLETL